MKKALIISVLLVFLFNIMGYYIVFSYSRYLVKKEMNTRIRAGGFHPDLILLKIVHPEKESQFRRREKNEFTFHGNLYDIVVERKSGDTTLFYCLHDKKEEALLANYSRCFRLKETSESSRKDNFILALLHNLISHALIQNTLLPVHNSGIAVVFPASLTPLIPVYLLHPAPPPKLT
ncbi:MAG: hypothetical protein NTW16_16755 [Bacteroidetes bacterium]|nr:hypothetical protein [Bacteroidota bacterium]